MTDIVRLRLAGRKQCKIESTKRLGPVGSGSEEYNMGFLFFKMLKYNVR